jgi:hypothetical protein
MTTRYRRVSKDLHDRCLQACWNQKEKLTEAEVKTLAKVASGWAGCFDVTKEEYDNARLILDRLGV